ncbi:MAG: hypothetical protein JWQ30_1473 [Sediminibacterium sp.]|nr:hypothetical protein [Sediminibacterium sp.]
MFYICAYMKRSFTYLFILACLILRVVTLSSCANILPPSGGYRDSLPPKLVSAFPKDSAVNVSLNTKTITLTFDEYVTMQNPLDVIVSPIPGAQFPSPDYKLKNVIIKLKDSLEPNTTYSFNFGDIIRDVNEGNIAKGFTYAFSTGNTIDQNTYSGKVLVAETGKPLPDSSLLVVLHRNLDDSAAKKSTPRYFARLDGKGEFIFHNLPKGNFAVYAVSNRFTKKYDDSSQLFAFRSRPVTISTNTPRDTLYAFEEIKRGVATTGTTVQQKPAPGKEPDKRLKYTVDADQGQQDILSNMVLTFNRKLFAFDSTKFVLYDTGFNRLSGYSFSLDSTKTKVTLQYKWKENSPYRLLIAKDAVADSTTITLLKADTLRFATKKETEYGLIRLRFSNLDLSKNPVLQLVQGEKLVESVPLTQADFQRKLFRPGTYDVRILYDANKNGKWDPGKFSEKKQPEIVFLVPKQVVIRANWDNDVTIPL